jgi:hypothetical protein
MIKICLEYFICIHVFTFLVFFIPLSITVWSQTFSLNYSYNIFCRASPLAMNSFFAYLGILSFEDSS